MPQSTSTQPQQPTPRVQAVRIAAQAANAHAVQPDTVTLRTMQRTVQTALNLGAHPDDIRQARAAVTR